MKYMGSKARHAKDILPIILRNRKPDQWYIEPFVGGANTFHLVPSPKIGNDTNQYVIEMLKAIGNGWIPPHEISEQEYAIARSLPEFMDKCTIGFIGIGCSYGGKWFGGYARGNDSSGFPRNYAEESANNILNQADGLVDSQWSSVPYDEMEIPDESIIYCDPPYNNSTKYTDSFNHEKFWKWCDTKIAQGHTVYVSEYDAPDGWECVWEKDVNSSLTKNTGAKKAVEKLFTRSQS